MDVARAVAAGVREWSRERPVAVVWHGGEPLTVGPAHFRALVEPFGPGGEHPVVQAVQTNGTLIDDAWCEVFATTPVRVTISLDGPDEANAARVDRSGRPSTDRTLKGVEALRRAGIRFGLIAVVADVSPGAARDVYRFARDLGCDSLGVNLAEKKGVYAGGHSGERPAVAFWQELAASWQADPGIPVRELDHAYTPGTGGSRRATSCAPRSPRSRPARRGCRGSPRCWPASPTAAVPAITSRTAGAGRPPTSTSRPAASTAPRPTTAGPARSVSWKESRAMPNTPAPEAPTPLALRIEACREPLAEPTARAGELHDTASIFGWSYLLPQL
ncbi:radical SAM protein [Streptomyces acidiscabies]